jgi:hypothetical protein
LHADRGPVLGVPVEQPHVIEAHIAVQAAEYEEALVVQLQAGGAGAGRAPEGWRPLRFVGPPQSPRLARPQASQAVQAGSRQLAGLGVMGMPHGMGRITAQRGKGRQCTRAGSVPSEGVPAHRHSAVAGPGPWGVGSCDLPPLVLVAIACVKLVQVIERLRLACSQRGGVGGRARSRLWGGSQTIVPCAWAAIARCVHRSVARSRQTAGIGHPGT